jgi:hypothetical protein
MEAWQIGAVVILLVALYSAYRAVNATPAELHDLFENAGPIQRANLVGAWLAFGIGSGLALFSTAETARVVYLMQLVAMSVAINADRKFTSGLTQLFVVLAPLLLLSLFATM